MGRHLNLTIPVAEMPDWCIRRFPGDAYSCIGEIQRQPTRCGVCRRRTLYVRLGRRSQPTAS
ncbi:hypothetical protein NPS70_10865 [Streptomyces sp. C10-9-1]|uniref:hypothetical protein n=1 Tax=Streptomyces sp. C10-9-1 TaxID=1859285 RepID=UPI0021137874|nr:hypothetical protein [Streptomyces sp. C10-9-1]MCQ6553693.1 hypothetical protein [Streptomyces sp. C10-9-1]